MILPFYSAEQAQDPEVVFIGEDPIVDPSVKVIVENSQKAPPVRRILGIEVPKTHRPTVVPYSWR